MHGGGHLGHVFMHVYLGWLYARPSRVLLQIVGRHVPRHHGNVRVAQLMQRDALASEGRAHAYVLRVARPPSLQQLGAQRAALRVACEGRRSCLQCRESTR